jgi:multiple sugar transport system permease protein
MRNTRKNTLTALAFASPWFLGFCIFMVYPLVASIYFSFCDYSVLRPAIWIGLDNYTHLLHDNIFWTALTNTAVYTVIALPVSLIVALGLAMLLNMKVKGMAFYRTLFFIPSLVPLVALAVLMQFIFNGQYGILNAILRDFFPFIHSQAFPPNWLGDPAFSKLVLVFISAWGAGNAMVIYLAGLQDVPVQLYEAADLDGAGFWAKTRNVTIPMISPVILFNLVMGIIGTLQVFTVPYVISPTGSPERSIYFYAMYLYDNAFIYHQMGYACAMGWILFVIIMILTLLSFRLSERHVHYGS